jgi:hypothetical protein
LISPNFPGLRGKEKSLSICNFLCNSYLIFEEQKNLPLFQSKGGGGEKNLPLHLEEGTLSDGQIGLNKIGCVHSISAKLSSLTNVQ